MAPTWRSPTTTRSASSSIPERTIFDTIGDGNDTVTVNGRTRHVNAYLRDFLFPPERAQSPVKALSGGERNRLLLARLFTRPANLLVLDEPTNDLDLETLELLEAQLGRVAGHAAPRQPRSRVSRQRRHEHVRVRGRRDRRGIRRRLRGLAAATQGGSRSAAAGQPEDAARQEGWPSSGSSVPQAAAASAVASASKKLSYRERRELDSAARPDRGARGRAECARRHDRRSGVLQGARRHDRAGSRARSARSSASSPTCTRGGRRSIRGRREGLG